MKMWISRNKSGRLYMYREKPILSCILDYDMFPEVTFENSPQKVEIKLVKEK